MSEIEGKVTRVGASERGQRASFNPTKGDEASSIAHQNILNVRITASPLKVSSNLISDISSLTIREAAFHPK